MPSTERLSDGPAHVLLRRVGGVNRVGIVMLAAALFVAGCGSGTSTAPSTPDSPATGTTEPTQTPAVSPMLTGSPTPEASASASPTTSPTPAPSPVSMAADYFEAINEQMPVEGFAEPDSPADGYGRYLALGRDANLAAGYPTSTDSSVEEVDGGFDVVYGPALEDAPDPIEFRDIQTNADGLVTTFTRNGGPIVDSLWTSEPVDGDGMQLGPGWALSNEQAMFVAIDVTNTTDEVFIVADATFVQDGRQFASDPAIDVVTFELGPGNTATMLFGTQGLATARDAPVTLEVEGGSPERQASISAEAQLAPIDG